jgi:hypothetical protein
LAVLAEAPEAPPARRDDLRAALLVWVERSMSRSDRKTAGQSCGRQQICVIGLRRVQFSFEIFFRGAPKCETESVWVATAWGSRDTREVPAASRRLSVGGAAAAGREGAARPAPGCVGRQNRPYSAGAP